MTLLVPCQGFDERIDSTLTSFLWVWRYILEVGGLAQRHAGAFLCFPCSCVSFLRVLWFPPTVQRHFWSEALKCPWAQVRGSVSVCGPCYGLATRVNPPLSADWHLTEAVAYPQPLRAPTGRRYVWASEPEGWLVYSSLETNWWQTTLTRTGSCFKKYTWNPLCFIPFSYRFER